METFSEHRVMMAVLALLESRDAAVKNDREAKWMKELLKYCIIIIMDEKIVSAIVQKCKASLLQYYGSRLKGVILYGSVARGEAGSSSDIDLLVLLSPPLDYFAELRQIVDLLYPIQLESARLISAKPASANDYEVGSISLYRNARREGVAV